MIIQLNDLTQIAEKVHTIFLEQKLVKHKTHWTPTGSAYCFNVGFFTQVSFRPENVAVAHWKKDPSLFDYADPNFPQNVIDEVRKIIKSYEGIPM